MLSHLSPLGSADIFTESPKWKMLSESVREVPCADNNGRFITCRTPQTHLCRFSTVTGEALQCSKWGRAPTGPSVPLLTLPRAYNYSPTPCCASTTRDAIRLSKCSTLKPFFSPSISFQNFCFSRQRTSGKWGLNCSFHTEDAAEEGGQHCAPKSDYYIIYYNEKPGQVTSS